VPGKGSRPFSFRVYWDTNIFISLFNGGQSRSVEELDGLNFWADLVDEGSALVVTSTLTLAEVLEFADLTASSLSPSQYKKFETFFHDHSRVEVVGVDIGVIRRTKEIREHHKNGGLSPRLTLPDAIHLATAANSKCDYLHTFDGAGASKGMISFTGAFPGVPPISAPGSIELTGGKRMRAAATDAQDALFDAHGVPYPHLLSNPPPSERSAPPLMLLSGDHDGRGEDAQPEGLAPRSQGAGRGETEGPRGS
jgi:predicted nucleic acid-binding protein